MLQTKFIRAGSRWGAWCRTSGWMKSNQAAKRVNHCHACLNGYAGHSCNPAPRECTYKRRVDEGLPMTFRGLTRACCNPLPQARTGYGTTATSVRSLPCHRARPRTRSRRPTPLPPLRAATPATPSLRLPTRARRCLRGKPRLCTSLSPCQRRVGRARVRAWLQGQRRRLR